MIRYLAFAAALAAAPQMVSAQQDIVGGTVSTVGSQRPLAGVQVTVQGQPARVGVTDASGRFRIAGLTGARSRSWCDCSGSVPNR